MEQFESYFTEVLTAYMEKPLPMGQRHLVESMLYTTLEPGKRFRPQLIVMIAELLQKPVTFVFPYAAAIEMIHSYSLIHDDLPCMDNDDYRRGKPSNHKVFGEALALLSGDALLTESFAIIAQAYKEQPALALEIILDLSQAIGWQGMVGGQAMDMAMQKSNEQGNVDLLLQMHRLKTGELIRISVSGAAKLIGLEQEDHALLDKFGRALGLAFQIADDLLDLKESASHRTHTAQLQQLLNTCSQDAIECLQPWGPAAQPLKNLVEFNLYRLS